MTTYIEERIPVERPWLPIVLVALLTSIIGATATVFVIERYSLFRPRSAAVETQVPDLQGLNENDARGNASAAHLTFFVAGREPTADVKPNTVIRQSPPPGQRVAQDQPIVIVMADELPRAPGVGGLTVADATQRLEQRGYRLEIAGKVPDANIPAGAIVEQSPRAEAAYAKGGAVRVQVSSGPPEVEVPKVLGVGVDKAKTELEKLGLKVVMNWVGMAETPTYVVLGQKPAALEKVKPGSDVVLTACR